MVRDLIEGARLLEQMAGSGNDHQLLRAPQIIESGLVHCDHRPVSAANNEKCGGTDQTQSIASKIRPSAAGYDSTDVAAKSRCGNQRCSGSRARSKIADREARQAGSPARPFGGDDETRCQQVDIEHVAAVFFFLGLQQIEQQGRQSRLTQDQGYMLVARTQATTPTAVRENDNAFRRGRQADQTLKPFGFDLYG